MLFYLGYSVFEDDGPAIRAINSLDVRETVAGPIIRPLLDQLQQVDQQIMETLPLAKAVKVGADEVRVHYTMAHLQRLGRQLVVRLARFIKVAIQGDVFGTGGSERLQGGEFYSGDPSESRINPDVGAPTRGDFTR